MRPRGSNRRSTGSSAATPASVVAAGRASSSLSARVSNALSEDAWAEREPLNQTAPHPAITIHISAGDRLGSAAIRWRRRLARRSRAREGSVAKVSPFDETYGLELRVCNEEIVEAVAPVRPNMMQVSGLVHGGVYAAMAESLASLGTNCGVRAGDQLALGASNHTSFLRPIGEGSVR